MNPKFERMLQSHGALLCAMTICALFLCAATVNSKQYSGDAKAVAAIDPFALKNPNAFDPARRRSVPALKAPRESAAHMASGIDAAEEAAPEDHETADATQPAQPRVAEATR